MNHLEVEGCPVADGKVPCPRCGGGWPGTKITTERMTKGVAAGIINPSLLGCSTLENRVLEYYEKLSDTASS